MRPHRLGHLGADAQHRVQRRRHLLEHEPDARSANVTHVALGELEKLLALEPDPAADDLSGHDEPDDRESGGALPTTGFADERVRLAAPQGERQTVDGADRTVINGPFPHPRELIAGFWLWDVKDMEEAVAWVKRCPNPMAGPSEIEIRPLHDLR